MKLYTADSFSYLEKVRTLFGGHVTSVCFFSFLKSVDDTMIMSVKSIVQLADKDDIKQGLVDESPLHCFVFIVPVVLTKHV